MKSREELRTKQVEYRRKWRSKNPDYKSPNMDVRSIWLKMIRRCLNSKDKAYKNYGGRGITVCKYWIESFDIFFNDMGKRPSKKHTLDRINNDKGYSKQNCRWATWVEQQSNRRDNIKLSINGQTKTASQWANELGFKRVTIYWRIKAGWPEADLFKKLRGVG